MTVRLKFMTTLRPTLSARVPAMSDARIPVPALSEERRKELVKVAKKHGEDCKVSIRKARHDALDMLSEMKSSGDASEDDVERAKKKAEEIVSEGGASVDQIIAAKEKEILVV